MSGGTFQVLIKIMQPEFLLDGNIEIQNQSNVCLNFHRADKINLKVIVSTGKFSSLLKLKQIITFICHFMGNLKLRKSNSQNKFKNSMQPYFVIPRIKYY